MKWQSHKVVTFFTIISLTGNPLFAFLSSAGSVLPDLIDFLLGIRHRTYSHLAGVWLLIASCFITIASSTHVYDYLSDFNIRNFLAKDFFVSLLYKDLIGAWNVGTIILVFASWISVGAFLHCLQDMFTISGVPIFNPKKSFRKLGLFRTGSKKEYVFCFVYTIICLVLTYYIWVK